MNLVQYLNESSAASVACVLDSETLSPLSRAGSMYELVLAVIAAGSSLSGAAAEARTDQTLPYAALLAEGRILPPVLHPDPAHTIVTGTGLTHLGSADTRNAMHAKIAADEATLTDSMKMFRMGVEGGKPAPGEMGVQPEWFYKGDGACISAPGEALPMPDFALDGGEEPEIAGLYIIAPDGQPRRLGFCLGNEFSDHRMEKINYLYLAHSKLRPCAIGPELMTGPLPADVRGMSRILRGGTAVWEKPFASGEDNMSHSIANLEAHHFKYAGFRRPGDVHVHFFGTATLSFADGIEARPGDVFEIEAAGFGRPLRNPLARQAAASAFMPVTL